MVLFGFLMVTFSPGLWSPKLAHKGYPLVIPCANTLCLHLGWVIMETIIIWARQVPNCPMLSFPLKETTQSCTVMRSWLVQGVLHGAIGNDCPMAAQFRREGSALSSACLRQVLEICLFVLWSWNSISPQRLSRKPGIKFYLQLFAHRSCKMDLILNQEHQNMGQRGIVRIPNFRLPKIPGKVFQILKKRGVDTLLRFGGKCSLLHF